MRQRYTTFLHFQIFSEIYFSTFAQILFMTPLQILTDLAIKDNQARFPLSWHEGKSLVYFSPKYSDKNEKGLVKCITDFLKFEGHQAERINNKGTRVDERVVVENVIGQMKTIGSVRWNYSQQERGTADVSATIKKRFGGINGVGGLRVLTPSLFCNAQGLIGYALKA